MSEIPIRQWEVETWTVVFERRPRSKWWDWLSPGGFRHVYCYGRAHKAGVWIVFDPTILHTRIAVFTDADFEFVLPFYVQHASLIAQLPAPDQPVHSTRIIKTCVGAIADVIGIRSRALRPIGLWRDMRQCPGLEFVYVEPEPENHGPRTAGRPGSETPA